MAADVRRSYLLNLQSYTGKVGGVKDFKQGERIFKDLITHYYKTGRGFTTGNYFTSVELANFLFEKGVTLTGTHRRDNRSIPHKLLKKPQREFSSEFCFHKDVTLLAYAPKKNRVVHLLSTEFHDSSLEENYKKGLKKFYITTVQKAGLIMEIE